MRFLRLGVWLVCSLIRARYPAADVGGGPAGHIADDPQLDDVLEMLRDRWPLEGHAGAVGEIREGAGHLPVEVALRGIAREDALPPGNGGGAVERRDAHDLRIGDVRIEDPVVLVAVRIVASRERAALREDLLPDTVEGAVVELRWAVESVPLGPTGEFHVVVVGGRSVGGAVGLQPQNLLALREGGALASGRLQGDGD